MMERFLTLLTCLLFMLPLPLMEQCILHIKPTYYGRSTITHHWCKILNSPPVLLPFRFVLQWATSGDDDRLFVSLYTSPSVNHSCSEIFLRVGGRCILLIFSLKRHQFYIPEMKTNKLKDFKNKAFMPCFLFLPPSSLPFFYAFSFIV